MERKKLRYVPGLLSLIGLPILLFLFSPEDPVQYTALKLNLPSDDAGEGHPFSEKSINHALKGKKIEKISLPSYDWNNYDDPGEKYLSNRKMIFIEQELERLQFTHDTSTVLKVTFDDGNSYGQYVNLINLAIVYRYRRYVYIDDDFYFFANDPPPPPCCAEAISPVELNLNLPAYQPPTAWNIFWWKTEYQLDGFWLEIKQSWVLSCGFVALIIIPFLLNFFLTKKLVTSFSVAY